jgi:putative nucleotidyltransferase-like protein
MIAAQARAFVQSGLSLEHRLLLCVARTTLDASHQDELCELIDQGIDWDYVTRAARWHKLTPLFYKHIETCCAEAVPAQALEALRACFRANTISNLLLTREMLSVLNLFEKHEISAVPFKGPTLAASVYGDVALRQFGDLDILVRREDVIKTRDLLAAAGYKPALGLSPLQTRAYLRFECEHSFTRGFYLEIHWDILPRKFSFSIDPKTVWRRLAQLDFEGSPVTVLSKEDLLLMLCVHGSKHKWERIGWICDVAELIKTEKGIAWRMVLSEARRLGCERMVLLGLLLGRDLLGAELPDEVVNKIERDRLLLRLAREVCEGLFCADGAQSGLLKNCLFYIRSRERPSDRLRMCARLLASPTAGDIKLLSVPAPLWFLYYLLRPARLASKYLLGPTS